MAAVRTATLPLGIMWTEGQVVTTASGKHRIIEILESSPYPSPAGGVRVEIKYTYETVQ